MTTDLLERQMARRDRCVGAFRPTREGFAARTSRRRSRRRSWRGEGRCVPSGFLPWARARRTGWPGETFSSHAGSPRRRSRRSCRRPNCTASRPVDDLVTALGMSGISKSQVSRLCEEIDEKVKAFLARPIEGDWPYLWIDATYLKVY